MDIFLSTVIYYFIILIFIFIGVFLTTSALDNTNSKKKTSNKNKLNDKELDLPMTFVNGKTGESKVVGELIKLPINDYLVLNDCTFRIKGKTTQIDHIVVSKYGIFVIETKHYNNCYIVGKDIDKKWTYISGKKKYFPDNPVRQNDVHVKRLMQLLNLNYDSFIPIVCICGKNCKLDLVSNNTVKITNLINRILSFKEEILPDYKYIYDKLKYYKIYDIETKKEHVYNIRNKKVNANNQKKCPWCTNGYLVRRESEYGKFYGCSNYPECNYKRNIK